MCEREWEPKKKEVARNSMQGTLKMHWNSCKMGCQMGIKDFCAIVQV